MSVMFSIIRNGNMLQTMLNTILYAVIIMSVAISFIFRKKAIRCFATKMYLLAALFIISSFVRTALYEFVLSFANQFAFLSDWFILIAFKKPLLLLLGTWALYIVSYIKFFVENKPKKSSEDNAVKQHKSSDSKCSDKFIVVSVPHFNFIS